MLLELDDELDDRLLELDERDWLLELDELDELDKLLLLTDRMLLLDEDEELRLLLELELLAKVKWMAVTSAISAMAVPVIGTSLMKKSSDAMSCSTLLSDKLNSQISAPE